MPFRSRGFTVIELLVVVSIIAILAGLALPALQSAQNTAKKAEASAMIAQLKTAITAFNTEYGVWPTSSPGTPSDSQLLPTDAYLILTGQEGGGDKAQNPRNIVFLELTTRDLYPIPFPPGGRATGIADPWSKTINNYTSQNYQIWVDSSYHNEIALPSPWGQTLNTGVAIWDPGAPIKNQVNVRTNTMIKSW